MVLTSALHLLLALTTSAETDLCTYAAPVGGSEHDLRRWLKDGSRFEALYCERGHKKQAREDAAKAVAALTKALDRDGYRVVSPPAAQAIELIHPSKDLYRALRAGHCRIDGGTVYTICATVAEDDALAGPAGLVAKGRALKAALDAQPEPNAPSAPSQKPGAKPTPPPDPRRAGRVHLE